MFLKMIADQKAMWHATGKEIESKFKEQYKLTKPASKARRGKSKQPQKEGNNELSSYAGALTKQFVTKMSLRSNFLSLSFFVFLS